MNAAPVLAPDAAMALGLASTAMPFARTPEAEAERWLRVLRLHGEAGIALQALGVSEMSVSEPGDEVDREQAISAGGDAGAGDVVARVAEHAVHIATQRGAGGVATTDLLMGVMHVYGKDFDRVLHAHGANCDELLEQLARQESRGVAPHPSAESPDGDR
jgi:hypothetical protein